jgi:hypothetical protein
MNFIPRGTLNDRYKVYTLQNRDSIPGGILNDRYKVYTLLTRDFIPGGILNDRYKVYTLQIRDFIPGNSECYHSEFPGYEVSSLQNVDLNLSFSIPPGMKSLISRV